MERNKKHSHRGLHHRHGKKDSSVKKKKKIKRYHRGRSHSSSSQAAGADDDYDSYLSPTLNIDRRSNSSTLSKELTSRRQVSSESSYGPSSSRKASKVGTDRRHKHKKRRTHGRTSSGTTSPRPDISSEDAKRPLSSVVGHHHLMQSSPVLMESISGTESGSWQSSTIPIASFEGEKDSLSYGQNEGIIHQSTASVSPVQLSTVALSSSKSVINFADSSTSSSLASSTAVASNFLEDAPSTLKKELTSNTSPISSVSSLSQKGTLRYRRKAEIRRPDMKDLEQFTDEDLPEKGNVSLAAAMITAESTSVSSESSSPVVIFEQQKDVLRLDNVVDKLEKQRRDRLEHIKALASAKTVNSESVLPFVDRVTVIGTTSLPKDSMTRSTSLMESGASKLDASKDALVSTAAPSPATTESFSTTSTEGLTPSLASNITSKKDRLSRFHAFAAARLASKSGTSSTRQGSDGASSVSTTRALEESTTTKTCKTSESNSTKVSGALPERLPSHLKMKLKFSSGAFHGAQTTSSSAITSNNTNALITSPISFFQETTTNEIGDSLNSRPASSGSKLLQHPTKTHFPDAASPEAEQIDSLDAFMLCLKPDVEAAQAVTNGAGNVPNVAIELPKAITLEEIQGWNLHKHKWSMVDETLPGDALMVTPVTSPRHSRGDGSAYPSSTSSPHSEEDTPSLTVASESSAGVVGAVEEFLGEMDKDAAAEEEAYYREFLEQMKRTSTLPTVTVTTASSSSSGPGVFSDPTTYFPSVSDQGIQSSSLWKESGGSVGIATATIDDATRGAAYPVRPLLVQEGSGEGALLDAFQNKTKNVDEEPRRTAAPTTSSRGFGSVEETEEEEKKRAGLREVPLPSEEAAGERLFSDEETEREVAPTDSKQPESYFDLVKKVGQKKELPPVDHSTIHYLPFRKNLYVQVREISLMKDHEVEALRKTHGNIKIRGKNCPRPIRTFFQCGLQERIVKLIQKRDYVEPFPIQMQAIPALMSGRDVIGVAETGSGKTLAYVLPMLRHVLDQPAIKDGDGPIALIISPTRELAVQIYQEVHKFCKAVNLRCVVVYGGTGIGEQLGALRRGTEVVVGTPGRLIDVFTISNGKVTNLRRVTFTILDEADRMFDMGFEPQISAIIRNIRPDRQTCLFSATFPPHIEALARKILYKPIEIIVGEKGKTASQIQQYVEVRTKQDKFYRLLQLLGEWHEHGSIIIFVSRQVEVDDLFAELLKYGYSCGVLHGGQDQTDREFTIQDFKESVKTILIATSVAARGLDVKAVVLVINYNAPDHLEDYVHRIGRTGRAGNIGVAYTFITPQESEKAEDLMKALRQSGQEISTALQSLADAFKVQCNMGMATAYRGKGFGGRGFKFTSSERSRLQVERQAAKKELGMDEEEEETSIPEGGGDGEGGPASLLEPAASTPPTTVAAAAAVAAAMAAGATVMSGMMATVGGSEGSSALAAYSVLPNVSLAAGAEAVRSLLNDSVVSAAARAKVLADSLRQPDGPLKSGTTGMGPEKVFEEQAEAIARTLVAHITDETQRERQLQLMKISIKDNLMKNRGAASNGVASFTPGVASGLFGSTAQLPSAVGKIPGLSPLAYIDPNTGNYVDEMDINDYPQQARYKITHKEILSRISEESGAVCQIKGQYITPEQARSMAPGMKRLYVEIIGNPPITIQRAKHELRLFMESISMRQLNYASNQRQVGRYSVV